MPPAVPLLCVWATVPAKMGKEKPPVAAYRHHGLSKAYGVLAKGGSRPYITGREVGAGKCLANPVRSGRKQP